MSEFSDLERLVVPPPKHKPGAIAILCTIIVWPVSVVLLLTRVAREWKEYKYKRYRRYLPYLNSRDRTASVTMLAANLSISRTQVREDINNMIAEGLFKVPVNITGDGSTIIFPATGASDYGNAGRVREASGWSAEQARRQAERDAEQARHQAERDAEQARHQAERDAEQARRQAERDAEQTRRQAERDAERIRSDAERDAKKHRDAPADPPAQGMTKAEARAYVPPKEITSVADISRILACLSVLERDVENKEVSSRIDRIQVLTRDIISRASSAEKEKEMRSFLSYYLPTTIRLLQSYALLEEQSYQGENILRTRSEIEHSLDAVVDGFEKFLDKLFSDEALDISSEISVLGTMLKKDGLTGDPSPFRPSNHSKDKKGKGQSTPG